MVRPEPRYVGTDLNSTVIHHRGFINSSHSSGMLLEHSDMEMFSKTRHGTGRLATADSN